MLANTELKPGANLLTNEGKERSYTEVTTLSLISSAHRITQVSLRPIKQ
jgi:hypothetical protein